MSRNTVLKILFLEDLPGDIELAERALRKGKVNFVSFRAETEYEFKRILDLNEPDLVISDYSLPSYDGMSALKFVIGQNKLIPFILLTGSMNEETAVECMKAGADDYVIKEHISRLPFAVIDALKKRKIQKKNKEIESTLIDSEAKYHAIFESTGTATLIVEKDTTISMANSKCFQLTGYSPEELIGKKWTEFVDPQSLGFMMKNHELRRKDPSKALKNYEVKLINRAGEIRNAYLDIGLIQETLQSVVSISDISELKKSQKALESSEKKFRKVVENSSNLFYSHTTDGILTFVSPQSEQFFGCSPEEAMVNWQNFITDNPVNLKGIEFTKRAIETGIQQPVYELELLSRNGNKLWVEVRESPVIENGKTIEITGNLANITEKKSTEKLLKSSEQKYRDIFLYAPMGIYVSNRKGDILNANNMFIQILGYDNIDEVLKLNLNTDVYIDKSIRLSLIEKFEKNGYADNIEVKWSKKDGSQIWVLLSSHIIKADNSDDTQFEGFVYDITDRKISEEILYLQSTALESAANGIVITDVNGNINWVNSAFTSLTQYSPEEVIARNPKFLKSGFQKEEFYDELWKTILSGKVWQGELINRRKDGKYYTEEMTVTPVRNRDYEITHFIAIKKDVSERIKFQNELIKSKEFAERSNKLKDAFIANISHEIRTPLNGILGMTNLIKNSIPENLKLKNNNYFEAIDLSSKRIVRTVDMILNYSRLQVGEFSLQIKEIDLSFIVSNVVKEFQSRASAKDIHLAFENKLNDAGLSADEFCVTQAISNLVDNAIKYTNKGFIKLSLYSEGSGSIMLDIEDSGIGIAEEYLGNVFEPYTQEDTGYNRSYEGVGLGMSLVKKYLDLNNAEITINSIKNRGTKVTVKFKHINRNKSSKRKSPVRSLTGFVKPDKNKIRKPDIRILIVEDDGINQMYINSILKKEYKTDTAYSAEQALKKLEKAKFDIILMDISLKGVLNGLELTKILKNKKEHKNTFIIAVTGHSSEKDRKSCFAAGCNEFLSKPFAEEELKEKIAIAFKDQH